MSGDAKLNKILKSEIETLYTEFAFSVDNLEQESERFRKMIEKMEDNV
ncbi:hypothetical protein AGMMS49921_13730 [Endomicrobiia bacterium]|nr:hypothetical protein AGMMS49921_13730 [Endomicrobiia bacterium]